MWMDHHSGNDREQFLSGLDPQSAEIMAKHHLGDLSPNEALTVLIATDSEP